MMPSGFLRQVYGVTTDKYIERNRRCLFRTSPHVSVDTSKFDLPVFTPAVAPVRIPTKTYDLVVSLGTDVHTFDRLLRWVEAYLEAHPEVTCLVQHGHTAPIKHADNLKLLPASELLATTQPHA